MYLIFSPYRFVTLKDGTNNDNDDNDDDLNNLSNNS